jgi:WD40 repeat protein
MYILTASDDKTSRIWNRDGSLLSTLLHTMPVRLAFFTPNGQSFMTLSGDTVVRIFDFSKVKATSTSETGSAQKNSTDSKIQWSRRIVLFRGIFKGKKKHSLRKNFQTPSQKNHINSTH